MEQNTRGADVQEANTIQVTFRLQGPLKRSTFQREPPDPVEETLGDVLHWSWSTRMQAARLKEDVSAEFAAWNRDGHYRTRHAFSKTSCDEHLLLVCAANLGRALDRLSKQFRRELNLPKPWRRALWLLRNVYEHWDELRRHLRACTDDAKGTVGKLRKEFPSADPWSFTIDPQNNEVILAGVVPLLPFIKELRRIEGRVLRLERNYKRSKTPGALISISIRKGKVKEGEAGGWQRDNWAEDTGQAAHYRAGNPVFPWQGAR